MSETHALVEVHCGDNWSFSGPLNDANGNPLPLANAQSITWRLDSVDGQTNYLTLTLGSGVQVTNNTTATVLYGPSAAQTTNLVPGTYYDALKVVLQDGETYTLVEGLINALPSL